MKTRPNIIAAIALGAAATLTLAACSSSGGTATPTSATGPAPTSAAATAYELAFIQGVTGDQFYITMQCGIEAEAKKLGVTVNTQGPQKFDATLQKPILDSVVATKPDGILIAPNDVNAMQAPLEAAAKAGINIALVDTTVSDPSFAVTAIASDNLGGGAEAFKAIQEAVPDGGKVLVMSLDPGISTTDARTKGFEEAVAKDPKFEYLGVQYSHNDPTTAAKLMTAALAKDPDIVGVFATNLFAAAGTSTGVKQAGKDGQITIVSFDAGPDQMTALRDGTVQALVAQDPYQIGVDGVNNLIASLDGNPVTKEIQTGFHLITQDNIDGEGAKYAYMSSCS